MKFKRWRDWKEGPSITEGRSSGGQIILKKRGEGCGDDTFLVRIGQRGSGTVKGTRSDAQQTLRALRTQLDEGTQVPSRTILFGRFLMGTYLPWKKPGLKPKTYGEYVKTAENRVVPVLG